jgi:putative PIN family toxin of toxin-antitoxin system
MIKVTFDTNVFISALCTPRGICASILTKSIYKYTLFTSKRILEEIYQVGNRDYFRKYFTVEDLEQYIDLIIRHSQIISLNNSTKESGLIDIDFQDTDDIFIFLTYKASNSHYLVTGNKKHFPKNQKGIINPREFFNIIESC